ncbi:MAG: hypothetical protein ABWZ25_06780 [Chitinophagaceae bacterium]
MPRLNRHGSRSFSVRLVVFRRPAYAVGTPAGFSWEDIHYVGDFLNDRLLKFALRHLRTDIPLPTFPIEIRDPTFALRLILFNNYILSNRHI